MLGLLSAAAGQLGDGDLATSIDEYVTILTKMLDATRDFADAAISIAKAIKGLDDVSADQILLGAGLGFTFAMIAVAIQISGLFGKPKPATQVILEQLLEIRKQIVDLRDEMRVRFDRIEKRLNKMYVGLLNRLAEMDFDLGQIEGNVDELQLALYDLHSELQRLNRNVHAFLEAAHRRELVEAINGFLRFRDRTGEDLSLQDFRTAENEFFSWGNDHAKDVLQAGPEDRSFEDEDLLGEITALPLATNVNYLRRLPAERLNLAALSAVRLANPFDWIVAAEAYAQLCEESPTRTVSPARVQALVAVGEALGGSLARIADDALFGALAAHYLASFSAVKDAIGAFELEFRIDPDTQLNGIDLWGGVEQEPATHPLDASFDELKRCDNRKFDASHDTIPVPPSILLEFRLRVGGNVTRVNALRVLLFEVQRHEVGGVGTRQAGHRRPRARERCVEILPRDQDPAVSLDVAGDECRQGLELDEPERRRGVLGRVHAEHLGDRAAIDCLGDRGPGPSLVVQPLPRLAPEALDLAEAVELQVDRRHLPQRARAAPVAVEERAGVIARGGAQDRARQRGDDSREEPAYEQRAVARQVGLTGRTVGGDRVAQLGDRAAQLRGGDVRALDDDLLRDAGEDVGLGIVPGARDGHIDRPVEVCRGNCDGICHISFSFRALCAGFSDRGSR
jgi:hypothetical protein